MESRQRNTMHLALSKSLITRPVVLHPAEVESREEGESAVGGIDIAQDSEGESVVAIVQGEGGEIDMEVEGSKVNEAKKRPLEDSDADVDDDGGDKEVQAVEAKRRKVMTGGGAKSKTKTTGGGAKSKTKTSGKSSSKAKKKSSKGKKTTKQKSSKKKTTSKKASKKKTKKKQPKKKTKKTSKQSKKSKKSKK